MHEAGAQLVVAVELALQRLAQRGGGARVVRRARAPARWRRARTARRSARGPSKGSTSYSIAATARCTNDTSRVVRRITPWPGGREPAHLAPQHALAQVERALVALERAVAHVERLVVDEQAQELAVRDVDHRLARTRGSRSRLGVGQRQGLVEAVEVRARAARRLALVEVAAQADVPVREREDRLGLREQVEVELMLGDRPRVDAEDVLADHALPGRVVSIPGVCPVGGAVQAQRGGRGAGAAL